MLFHLAERIANEMIAAGATTVIAWGGDGTINEVANAAAAADVTLGVVPGGSGNGFARGLKLPLRAREALQIALSGRERTIDTGVIEGRRFVNVAGVGFDAHLAAVFNRLPARGPAIYFRVGLRQLCSYRASTYTVRAGSHEFQMRAFLMTVANGPEYGAGAVIAPMARLDDGVLDLVCLPPGPLPSMAWQARRLFSGTVDRVPHARIIAAPTMEISAAQPLLFHVDGEVVQGSTRLPVRVDRSALRVRVYEPG